MFIHYSTGHRVSQYQFARRRGFRPNVEAPKNLVKLCKEIYCILLYKCYNKDVLRGVTFMAQVMVNFRMDENVKKSMEQACREMGMSMTTAFTIFATKVGKEQRIPFEVTAEPYSRSSCREEIPEAPQGDASAWRRERLESLCGEIRRSLTSIHTAIPAAVTGLSMERIRLLCGDELKDKTAGIASAARALFSGRGAGPLGEKDWSVFDEYLDGLTAIAEDIRSIADVLVPAMKAWSGGDGGVFAPYEQRLAAASRDLDGLQPVLQRFLRSTARRHGSARSVQSRIQQAAAAVETPYVLSALEGLEALVLRHYDSLDGQTKARLESHYLQTLELALQELGQTEQAGEAPGEKAALCLRAVNVLSQVLSNSGQARREQARRNLEAEVAALENLAAMRGDIANGMTPDG